jgi:hypothetical protein
MQADNWRALRTVDVLLVRHDADCGYVHQGRAYAPLVDTVGDWCEALGLRVQSLASPYSRLRGDDAFHHPVTINRPMLRNAIVGRALRRAAGAAAGVSWANSRRRKIWEKLLQRAHPRAVIGINPDLALCWAGRCLGVPVYDLQHGLIDNNTPWYAGMADAAPGAAFLPTGVLCWDAAASAEVGQWAPARGVAVETLGNPWVARFLELDLQDTVVALAQVSVPRFPAERPRIVVSLQWGLAEHHYPDPAFNGVMVDALERAILATADRYNWMLRLHPVQMRGEASHTVRDYLQRTFGGTDSVEWERSSVAALPALLSSATAHVTDYSSVVMEAACFGVPSAMLNPSLAPGRRLADVYRAEREAGLAEVVEQDANSLIRWIEAQERRSAAPLPHVSGRRRWEEFLSRLAR